MQNYPLLSIVVPCYNEAANIPHIVALFNTIVKQYDGIEVILVNNGSTDNSAKVLLQQQLENNIKVHTVPVNKGYGYGILQGLAHCTAPILSWTHADLQTHPDDVVTAYEKYKDYSNRMLLVKGKRRKRNFSDAFFTWAMSVYTQWKLNVRLNDINAQPKLFSRTFYDAVKDKAPNDFSLDLYWLYKAKQMGAIVSIDVVFSKRKFGEAKGGGTLKGKWKLIKRTMAYINQLKQQL